MRISDWSSDVCSSDLVAAEPDRGLAGLESLGRHDQHAVVIVRQHRPAAVAGDLGAGRRDAFEAGIGLGENEIIALDGHRIGHRDEFLRRRTAREPMVGQQTWAERRVWTECVSTVRYRLSTEHLKHKDHMKIATSYENHITLN